MVKTRAIRANASTVQIIFVPCRVAGGPGEADDLLLGVRINELGGRLVASACRGHHGASTVTTAGMSSGRARTMPTSAREIWPTRYARVL